MNKKKYFAFIDKNPKFWVAIFFLLILFLVFAKEGYDNKVTRDITNEESSDILQWIRSEISVDSIKKIELNEKQIFFSEDEITDFIKVLSTLKESVGIARTESLSVYNIYLNKYYNKGSFSLRIESNKNQDIIYIEYGLYHNRNNNEYRIYYYSSDELVEWARKYNIIEW